MADFIIKQGTTVPHLPGRLEDGNGAALDLSNASVMLRVTDPLFRTVVFEHPATVLVANPDDLTSDDQANVKYVWQPSDTAIPGIYWAEWLITRTGNTDPEIVPGTGYMVISITRVGGL